MKSGNFDSVLKKTKLSYFIPLPLKVRTSLAFVLGEKKRNVIGLRILTQVR